jgi:hypothetical protein
MQVLPLEFIQTSQLFLKLIDSSQTASTISNEESLAVTLFHPQTVPKPFNGSSQIFELAFAAFLLLQQLLASCFQTGKI